MGGVRRCLGHACCARLSKDTRECHAQKPTRFDAERYLRMLPFVQLILHCLVQLNSLLHSRFYGNRFFCFGQLNAVQSTRGKEDYAKRED